jgi:hypothetical protein
MQCTVEVLDNKVVSSKYSKDVFLDFVLKDYPRRGVSTPMHGVYEGSYRDLMGDLEAIIPPLRQLNTRPPELRLDPTYTAPAQTPLPVYRQPPRPTEPPEPKQPPQLDELDWNPPQDDPYPPPDWREEDSFPHEPAKVAAPTFNPPEPRKVRALWPSTGLRAGC